MVARRISSTDNGRRFGRRFNPRIRCWEREHNFRALSERSSGYLVPRPEEVAAAIYWLCADKASYVSGAILDVTGGR